MESPLISVCIPTYNGEKYLQEALNSVLQQTYTNIEIIVSDDSSQDKTLEIVEIFKNKSPFPVQLFNHTPNGIAANWDNCIENANGKFIKFLFQDDILEPNCIAEFVKIQQETKKEIFFCKRTLIDSKGKTLNKNIPEVTDLQEVINININNYFIFTKKNLKNIGAKYPNKIHHNFFGEPVALFFSKEIYQQTGKFNPNLKQLLDIEYWLRLLLKNDVVILQKKLIRFRIHEEQTSSKNALNRIDESKIIQQYIYNHFFKYLNNKVKIKYLYSKYPFIGKIRGKIPF